MVKKRDNEISELRKQRVNPRLDGKKVMTNMNIGKYTQKLPNQGKPNYFRF